MRNSDKEKTPGSWDIIFQSPENYKYYDLFKPHEAIPLVASCFKEQEVEKVLDLGCGAGNNLFALQEAGFTLTGVDQSSQGIDLVKKKMKELKRKAVLVQARFQQLPFPKSCFDALVSVQTLNHGYEADVLAGISEIERVLKPQGIIFVTLAGRIANGEVRYSLVKTAKRVEERVYLPQTGQEIGVPHFIYNLATIKKHFQSFVLLKIWRDSRGYYCFLGRKK